MGLGILIDIVHQVAVLSDCGFGGTCSRCKAEFCVGCSSHVLFVDDKEMLCACCSAQQDFTVSGRLKVISQDDYYEKITES